MSNLISKTHGKLSGKIMERRQSPLAKAPSDVVIGFNLNDVNIKNIS